MNNNSKQKTITSGVLMSGFFEGLPLNHYEHAFRGFYRSDENAIVEIIELFFTDDLFFDVDNIHLFQKDDFIFWKESVTSEETYNYNQLNPRFNTKTIFFSLLLKESQI